MDDKFQRLAEKAVKLAEEQVAADPRAVDSGSWAHRWRSRERARQEPT